MGDQERGGKRDKKYKNVDWRNSESPGIGEGGEIQEVGGCYPLHLPAASPTPSPYTKVILVPFEYHWAPVPRSHTAIVSPMCIFYSHLHRFKIKVFILPFLDNGFTSSCSVFLVLHAKIFCF